MKEKEEVIVKYVEAWKKRNITEIEKYFDSNITIKDPFVKDIQFSFKDLEKEIAALTIEEPHIKIINFVHQGAITLVEWELTCIENGQSKKYEGLSFVKFNPKNLIVESREHVKEVQLD